MAHFFGGQISAICDHDTILSNPASSGLQGAIGGVPLDTPVCASLESLKTACVADGCRLTKIDDVEKLTLSVKLVFPSFNLPSHVRLLYAQYKVKAYVPLWFNDLVTTPTNVVAV